jgi:fibronectin-binding autotransporter adhesin
MLAHLPVRSWSGRRVHRRGFLLAVLAVVSGLTIGGRDAVAANYFWDTTTGTWATGANWSSNYAIGGPFGTAPGAGDTAFFNQSTVNGTVTGTIGAATSVDGIVFNNTGATTLVGDGTQRVLTIGATGIRVNPGAGAVTLGTANSATTTNVYVQLGASQAWTNNSANAVNIAGQLSSAAGQNYVLTIGGSGNTQTQGNATAANQGRIINPSGGTTAVVKVGSGTMSFNEAPGGTGVSTFTGGLTVNAGRVTLNSTAASTSGMTNIIGNQALTMGGGQLSALWANTVTTLSNQQSFTSLTLNPGASLINSNNTQSTTNANAVINLNGTITRNAGATLTLYATGAVAGRAYISGTNWGNSTTILDNGVAYVTAFGSTSSNPNPSAFADNWAATNASGQVANNAFSVTYTPANSGTLTGNADIASGVDTTLSTSQASTSLRFNQAQARTVTINSGNAFTTGGILVTSTVAGNLSTITGGTLQSAATVANKDLVFILNNATGTTAVASTIVDGTAGLTGLTKSGPGTLSLTGANTYTGPTYLNGGTTLIASDGTGSSNPLGAYPGSVTAGAITLNGGGLQATSSLTIAANRGITLGGNGGSLDASAGQTLTVSSAIAGGAGTGALTKGANQSLLILGASNSFTGGLAIAGGTVQLAASTPNALGTGFVAMAQSNTGTFGASSVLSLNGNSVTIADLRTTGTVGPNPAVLQNASATPVTLTIGDSQNFSGSTFAGILQDGTGGGALNLVKTGAGTVTLAPSLVRGVTTTTGTNVVLVSDTSFFQIGTQLTAPGIGGSVTITAINSGSITLSGTATASATVTGTFFQRLNNNLSGTVTVANGQLVSSYGFGANTPLVVGDSVANTAGAVQIAGSQSVSSLSSAGTAGLGNKVLINGGNTFTITGTTTGGALVSSTFNGSIGENGLGALSIGVGGATPSGAVVLGGSNAIPTITVVGGTAVFASTLAVASGTATINIGSGGNSGTNPTIVFRTPSTVVSSTGAFGALVNGPSSTGGIYSLVLDYSGSAAFNQSLGRLNVGSSSGANATISAINVGSGTGSMSFTNVTYSQAGGGNPGVITANANVIIGGSVTTSGSPSANASPILTLGGTATGSRIDGVIMNNTAGGSFTHTVQITKAGAGRWALNNANTYTGTTTISAGTLNYGNVAAFGTGTLAFSGASTLQSGVASGTVANAIVLPGVGVTGTFDSQSNSNTLSGLISGAGNIAKIGSGTFTLGGTTSITGTTSIAEGALTLAGSGTGGLGALSVATASGTGATLNIVSGSYGLGGNFFSVGNSTSPATSGTVNQTGGIVGFSGTAGLLVGNNNNGSSGVYNLSSGTLQTSGGSNSTTRGIVLGVNNSSSGTFTMTGGRLDMVTGGSATLQIGRGDSATQTVSGTSVFSQSGGLASVGTLAIGGTVVSGTGFGTGGQQILTLTGGTFSAGSFSRLAAGTNNVAVITIGGAADVTLPAFPTFRGTGATATVNFDGGVLRPLASSTAYMGGLTSANVLAGGATFAVGSGNDITVSQNLLASGTSPGGGLTKQGVGRLTLTGSNTYTGGNTIQSGTLLVGNVNALGASSGGLAVNGGTLDLAGFSPVVGTFSGSAGAVVTSASTASLTATSNVNSTFAGSFTGAAGLTKGGTGLLALTGSSSSTGAFAVNSGTLAVNGVLGTGPVSVAATGWLQGSGTIGGAVNVIGTLSPGNSPGIITLGSVTLGGSSSTIIEINGLVRSTQYDGVNITGTGSSLQYGGLLSLSFGNGSAFDNGTTFDIFNFGGLFSGTYSSVISTGFYTGTWAPTGSGTYQLVSGAQTLTFDPTSGDIVVVPEPAAIALAGIGLGLAGRWLARRRRQV